jgi:hypothetical protein
MPTDTSLTAHPASADIAFWPKNVISAAKSWRTHAIERDTRREEQRSRIAGYVIQRKVRRIGLALAEGRVANYRSQGTAPEAGQIYVLA